MCYWLSYSVCLFTSLCQLRARLEQHTFKSVYACAGGAVLLLHIFVLFQIPLRLFIQPLPLSMLSTYLCQFALPPFSRFVNDFPCTFSWSFTIFSYSFQTTSSCLDPSRLSIIIVILFSSRYQFLSTRLFPSACDVLLRHFIPFGSIITLAWFHLFYLHADVFFNDIEFSSVSVSRCPFRLVLIYLAKLHLHIRSVSFR